MFDGAALATGAEVVQEQVTAQEQAVIPDHGCCEESEADTEARQRSQTR